jgi:hypothetical protein
MEAIMGYALALENSGSAYLAPLFAEASEMPLRSLGTLRDRRFTAWRGRSGQRYVTSVFTIMDPAALSYADAVLLAVAPDRHILAARDSGPFGIEAALKRWRDTAMQAGATELHIHLLAEDDNSRRNALADLVPLL